MKNEIGDPVGNCPVQSEGFIDDHPYYFRSRGSHWTFDVSKPGADPVAGGSEYYKAAYVGEWPAAGWLPVEDAKRVIAECVQEFQGGKRGSFPCPCPECINWRGMTEEQRLEKLAAKLWERRAD